MNGGALSGLKVIEYGEFISGPYCGKLLADLGADVIKIEEPSIGDKARRWGPFPQDIPHPEKSGLFLYLNTNKLGVTLNLRSATGLKIFKELVKQVDIVVENNPVKEMERLNLDYESLHKINPALVVTSITPFGQKGPYRDYKSCDLISFHASGEAYMNPPGEVDNAEQQPPLKLPGHSGDFMAGLSGAICTMSAVISQQITGVGQHVDLSEQEALSYMLSREVGEYTDSGTHYYRDKSKVGGATPKYLCKNGYVMLLAEPAWAGLVDMLGNPDWAKSEVYQTPASRRDNWGKIQPKIIEWMKEHTTEEVSQAALARRIPCSSINSAKEVVNSEQLAARDYFVEVGNKKAGKVKYPGAPYKLSGTPWRVNRPAPLLGEHNDQVYCQMLGYTRQDLVRMNQAGVI